MMGGSNGRRQAIENRFDGKREEKVHSNFGEERDVHIREVRRCEGQKCG